MKRERPPFATSDVTTSTPVKRATTVVVAEDNGLLLSFRSSPATTWASGSMDIEVSCGGMPLAFMVVRDGVFLSQHVFRDARSNFAIGDRLRASLSNYIIAGCIALIMRECPSVLCKQKCSPVKGL